MAPNSFGLTLRTVAQWNPPSYGNGSARLCGAQPELHDYYNDHRRLQGGDKSCGCEQPAPAVPAVAWNEPSRTATGHPTVGSIPTPLHLRPRATSRPVTTASRGQPGGNIPDPDHAGDVKQINVNSLSLCSASYQQRDVHQARQWSEREPQLERPDRPPYAVGQLPYRSRSGHARVVVKSSRPVTVK